jgi:chemotaxis protein histidine kinase CheA
METYFQNDPRIRKWVNQIINRIFTVCILNGVDSDEEFQKGCQIVMNLTSLLKDIPNLPSEFLADGVKQLIEQQLPDACVMNNFPTFQAIMDRMLREGILKATDTQKKEASNSISTANTKDIITEPHDSYTDSPMEVSNMECVTDEALAQAETAKADAQALAEALAQAETQAKADAQALAEALAQAETAKADAQALTEALAQAETQAKADAQALVEAFAQVDTAKADAQALTEALAQAETQAKADAQALAEALAQVNSFTKAGTQANADALAIAEALAQVDSKLEAITKIERYELAKPMSNIENAPKEKNTIKVGTELEPFAHIKVPALLTSINSKISQIFSTTQVPQQADLLRQVLSNMFPKGTVYWNKRLMDQVFLAQVEDILICLHDPEHPCNLKKYNKVGWKVLVFSYEDLTFPRRLERKIKQIQRLGKISATV